MAPKRGEKETVQKAEALQPVDYLERDAVMPKAMQVLAQGMLPTLETAVPRPAAEQLALDVERERGRLRRVRQPWVNTSSRSAPSLAQKNSWNTRRRVDPPFGGPSLSLSCPTLPVTSDGVGEAWKWGVGPCPVPVPAA